MAAFTADLELLVDNAKAVFAYKPELGPLALRLYKLAQASLNKAKDAEAYEEEQAAAADFDMGPVSRTRSKHTAVAAARKKKKKTALVVAKIQSALTAKLAPPPGEELKPRGTPNKPATVTNCARLTCARPTTTAARRRSSSSATPAGGGARLPPTAPKASGRPRFMHWLNKAVRQAVKRDEYGIFHEPVSTEDVRAGPRLLRSTRVAAASSHTTLCIAGTRLP